MTGVPPAVKVIAFLVVLAAAYELAPSVLWATLGLVLLYLVLAHGSAVASLIDQVPDAFAKLVSPAGVAGGHLGPRPQ